MPSQQLLDMKNRLKLCQGAAGGGRRDGTHERPALPLHAIWRRGRKHEQMTAGSRTGTGGGGASPARRGQPRSPAPRPAPPGRAAGNRSPGEVRAAPPAPLSGGCNVRLSPARSDRPARRTLALRRVKQNPAPTHPLLRFPPPRPPHFPAGSASAGPRRAPAARTAAPAPHVSPRRPRRGGSAAAAQRTRPHRPGRAPHRRGGVRPPDPPPPDLSLPRRGASSRRRRGERG